MLVTVAGYVIDRNLASHLAAGSLSSMQYATTLLQFPLGMVGLATSYAVLPTLSRFGVGVEQNIERYREALLFGVKVILLLALPALAGLAVLAAPTVQLLFERGAFTPADTLRTARVFLAYLPQLPFTALDYLLITAFYARQNTRTPVVVGVVATLLYLVVALPLVGPLGPVGLALADATKNSGHALILLVLLRRALPDLRLGTALAPFLARVVPISALMGAALAVAWPRLSQAGALLGLAMAIPLAVVLYAALVTAAGVPEARTALAAVRARASRAT
jgi:putative peptidoglycan lipid II flippase